MTNTPPDYGVYKLTLYVAYVSASTERLAETIRQWFAERCLLLSLTIVEVVNDIDRAIEHRVFATPMLVREAPMPERRVVGELSSVTELMKMLEISGPA